MPRVLLRLFFVVVPAVVLVTATYAAIWGDSGILRRSRLVSEHERVSRQLSVLRESNARLYGEITGLRTDRTVVQRVIAEELVLAPEGSTIYRFPAQP
jgi:cell division protein FtsB